MKIFSETNKRKVTEHYGIARHLRAALQPHIPICETLHGRQNRALKALAQQGTLCLRAKVLSIAPAHGRVAGGACAMPKLRHNNFGLLSPPSHLLDLQSAGQTHPSYWTIRRGLNQSGEVIIKPTLLDLCYSQSSYLWGKVMFAYSSGRKLVRKQRNEKFLK